MPGSIALTRQPFRSASQIVPTAGGERRRRSSANAMGRGQGPLEMLGSAVPGERADRARREGDRVATAIYRVGLCVGSARGVTGRETGCTLLSVPESVCEPTAVPALERPTEARGELGASRGIFQRFFRLRLLMNMPMPMTARMTRARSRNPAMLFAVFNYAHLFPMFSMTSSNPTSPP